jgi:phosphate transport system permease protein
MEATEERALRAEQARVGSALGRRSLGGRVKEFAIEKFLLANGLLAIAILTGIFILLVVEGLPAARELGPAAFLGANWNPTAYGTPSYGILSLVVSTMMVSFGALIIAVPLGVLCAAYIAEAASPTVREIVKPTVEVLAGIPSVVVGFLGLVIVGPAIARLFGQPNGLNALNGSLLLAVMSLPTIVSLSEDAISAVPRHHKEGSLALGAGRWQTLWRVTIPAALSGIIAAVMLGMGRAIGETMTVLMACGNALAMPQSYLEAVRPMTANIAIELGEVPFGSLHYSALFVIGFVLFLMTFAVNLVSDIILHKWREEVQ